MPVPAIVAGAAAVAARLAAKKVAQEAAKKAAKAAAANARGLKAAQKPTNKTGTKADRAQRAELQGNSNLIKNAEPARANRTRGGSLYAQKVYGGQGLVSKTLTPKQAANRAALTKELNPVRNKSADAAKIKNDKALKAANKTTKASKVQKKITSTKKMENVPKDVSDRFNATVKRLAAESAKKK